MNLRDYVLIAIYFAIGFAIGFAARRRITSSLDFGGAFLAWARFNRP